MLPFWGSFIACVGRAGCLQLLRRADGHAHERAAVLRARSFGDLHPGAHIRLQHLAQAECRALQGHPTLSRYDRLQFHLRVGGIRPERAQNRRGQVVQHHVSLYACTLVGTSPSCKT